jgi:hypothetical protein
MLLSQSLKPTGASSAWAIGVIDMVVVVLCGLVLLLAGLTWYLVRDVPPTLRPRVLTALAGVFGAIATIAGVVGAVLREGPG